MTPEVIFGPPGTGKTTSLLGIVDEELGRGVPPDRIAYLSFTRRAAEEAVGRACSRFRLDRKALPYFRTLHSLAFRELGLTGADVFEGPRLREFAEWACVHVTSKGWDLDEGVFYGQAPGDRCLFLENLARVRCRELRDLYDEADDGLDWDEVERVARALSLYKRSQCLLDFTDMLEQFLAGGSTPDTEVLLVDEAQDLSPLQWRVVRKMAAGRRRVVVAGDDDQAIYHWAGADVGELVRLEGRVSVLGRSYRVPRVVQSLATDIISEVTLRRPKVWAARGEPGELCRAEHLEEADLDRPWDADHRVQPVLVLARNTYVLRDQVEPELRRMGVLYEWRDQPALDPALARAVLTWEQLREGKAVEACLARAAYQLMTPGRGVERAHRDLAGVPDDYPVTLDELGRDYGCRTTAVWREALDRIPPDDVDYIIAAVKRREPLAGRPRVRLSTIHGAKGGEAAHVVLMSEMATRTYREMEREPDEERRVWYTGVTRARSRLTVMEGTRTEVCPWV